MRVHSTVAKTLKHRISTAHLCVVRIACRAPTVCSNVFIIIIYEEHFRRTFDAAARRALAKNDVAKVSRIGNVSQRAEMPRAGEARSEGYLSLADPSHRQCPLIPNWSIVNRDGSLTQVKSIHQYARICASFSAFLISARLRCQMAFVLRLRANGLKNNF